MEDTESSIFQGGLPDFFRDLLDEAAGRRSSHFSPIALDYVCKVLVNFHESRNFFTSQDAKFPILSDLLHEALEADIYRRISIYRQLGDTSLLVAGAFSEAIQKRSMDVRYYTQMGETAYSQLGDLTDKKTVFLELSEEFIAFVELVRSAFHTLKLKEDSVENLFKAYAEQNSEEALELLKEKNIFPLRNSEDEES